MSAFDENPFAVGGGWEEGGGGEVEMERQCH